MMVFGTKMIWDELKMNYGELGQKDRMAERQKDRKAVRQKDKKRKDSNKDSEDFQASSKELI